MPEMSLGPARRARHDRAVRLAHLPALPATSTPTSIHELKRQFIDTGKVRYILREFPIGKTVGHWPRSRYAARRLRSTWTSTGASWTSRRPGCPRTCGQTPIFAIAQQVGMTRPQFDACRENQGMIENLKWVKERGRKLGIIGTPNFFVGNKLIKNELTIDEIRRSWSSPRRPATEQQRAAPRLGKRLRNRTQRARLARPHRAVVTAAGSRTGNENHATAAAWASSRSSNRPNCVIEPGLTGVVGPNGCGKSNLLEALRWVMGETSHKSMRAAAMDDVIFSGTTTRPGAQQRRSDDVSRQLARARRRPNSTATTCSRSRAASSARPARPIASTAGSARARRQSSVRGCLDRRPLAGARAPGPDRRDSSTPSPSSAAASWRMPPVSPACTRAVTRPNCA